jgi:hypothetical protein
LLVHGPPPSCSTFCIFFLSLLKDTH